MDYGKTLVIVFLIVGALLSAAYTVSAGFVGFGYFKPAELKLGERDVKIYAGQELCFSFGSDIPGEAVVEYAGKQLKTNKSGVCLNVSEGKGNVTVSKADRRVWFLYESVNATPPPATDTKIDVEISGGFTYNNIPAKVTIENGYSKGRVFLVSLFHGSSLLKELPVELQPGEKKQVEGLVRVTKPGAQAFTAELDTGETAEKEIYVRQNPDFFLVDIFKMAGILGFVLLFLPWIIIFRKNPVSVAAFSLLFLVLMPLIFNFFVPMHTPFIASLIFLGGALFAVRKKIKLKLPKKEGKNEIKLAVIVFLLLTVVASAPKLLGYYNTPWNTFYERQVRETYYSGNIPQYDPLSYEGRPMTFVPGYFSAKASFLWLVGLEPGILSDIVFETFINFMLVLSMVFVSRHLELGFLGRTIFIMAFIMTTFVYVLVSSHLLHVLSFALLFFSIGFFLRKNYLLSSLALAAAAITHAFALVLYPLYLVGIFFLGGEKSKKVKTSLKNMAKSLLFGVLIFAVLYSPILANGLPYEIAADQWGYLVKWGTGSFVMEFIFLVPLFLAALFYNTEKKKLIAFFIVSAVLFSFVSFRLNVVAAFLGSLLVARWLDKEKILAIAGLALILLNFIPILYVASGFREPCDNVYLTEECNGAMNYLSLQEGTVLAGPIYGHTITSSGLKVVADPYVEYADPVRFNDIMEFEKNNNTKLAEKWNVSFVLSSQYVCDRDLVYDNGYLRICWRNRTANRDVA